MTFDSLTFSVMFENCHLVFVARLWALLFEDLFDHLELLLVLDSSLI